MANKKYSSEVKIEVVRRYIAGEHQLSLWKNLNCHLRIEFSNGTKYIMIIFEMSKDEYIEYLEMENDILMYLADSNQE